MIHFVPLPADGPTDDGGSEMLARIAGLKRALRLVDPFGGGPASDIDEGQWSAAGPALRRCFDRRSEGTIAAATAGLEAVLSERKSDREPMDAALRLLADEIRSGLADLSSLVRSAAVEQPVATPAPSPWG